MDTRKEFDFLKNYLEANGLYERGMTVDDMKKVQQALLESLNDSGFDVDMEIALRESEQNFMQEMLHNSTMIVDGNYNNSQSATCLNSYCSNTITVETGYLTESARSASPPSSPDNPQTILVFAQVHHELNYEPESEPKYC